MRILLPTFISRRRLVMGVAPTLFMIAAVVRPAHAQKNRLRRIGYLGPSSETAPHLVQAFRDGLRERGLIEGQDIVIEWRWTNNAKGTVDEAALLKRATELIDGKVDVLAVSIDPAALAVRKASDKVPVVMMNVSDPVALGLVKSLAHPGGNMTGLSRLTPDIVGKNLQLLWEAVRGYGAGGGAGKHAQRDHACDGRQRAQYRNTLKHRSAFGGGEIFVGTGRCLC